MKIRTDFVTNSSSSSFVLARSGEFTQQQKESILRYIQEEMLGEAILTPQSTEEEIQKVVEERYLEDQEKDIRKALAEGKTIYYGWVSFDECDYSYGELFSRIWEMMEEQSPENFTIIDGDLSY